MGCGAGTRLTPARYRQHHRCIHHSPCPARGCKEPPAEQREMEPSTEVLHSPRPDDPGQSVPRWLSPPGLSSAENKQTHGRGGPTDFSAASAPAFQAERGRRQREAKAAGPEVSLGFKRHL